LIEDLWSFGFQQMRVDQKISPVLVTGELKYPINVLIGLYMIVDSCFSSPLNKETVTELLFEKFDAPALFLARSPTLSSFCYCKT